MVALRTPAGTPLLAFSRYEGHVLLHEMYHGSTDSRLAGTGLQLPGAPAVPYIVDVGANVGLFTLWVKEQFPTAHVVAVEALPPTAAVLRANVAAAGATDVHVKQTGAGSAPTTVTFSFCAGMSVGAASLAGDAAMAKASAQAAAGSDAPAPGLLPLLADITVDAWRTLLEVHTAPAASVEAAQPAELRRVLDDAGILLPGSAVTALDSATLWGTLLAEVLPLLAVKEQHEVPLVPVSTLLAEHEAEHLGGATPVIDYLKVDVEGAEEDVLAGVAEADWARTRNAMVEVHDAGGALARVLQALQGRGFTVAASQEVWRMHKRLGIFLVFARREAGWTPPATCCTLPPQ